MITKEQPDGSYRSIFCAMDGYPDGVGDQLHRYYQDQETIDRLLDLGALESLGISPDNPITTQDRHRIHTDSGMEEMERITEGRCITSPRNEATSRMYDARDHHELLDKLRISKDPEWAYIWGEGGWIVCGLWETNIYGGFGLIPKCSIPKMEPVSLESALSGALAL